MPTIIMNRYIDGTAYKTGLHGHIDAVNGPDTSDGGGDDGDHSPTAVASLCSIADMDAWAVTSHSFIESVESVFNSAGVLWIPGVEFTCDLATDHDTHITGIGIFDNTVTHLNHGLDFDENEQTTINTINTKNGFAVICHPNLDETYNITLSEILALDNFHAIEVAGPLCAAHFYGQNEVYMDGSHNSTNVVDAVIKDKGFISLVAASDFHRTSQLPGPVTVFVDQGFQVVYADALTIIAITQALKDGNSYATEGPLLSTKPTVTDGVITINSVDSCTCVWTDEDGVIVQSDGVGTQFTYTPEIETHVRATLTRGSDDKMIWIQPFLINSGYIWSDVDGTKQAIYSAYDGEVFSPDGINYYTGNSAGTSASASAIGLTAYIG